MRMKIFDLVFGIAIIVLTVFNLITMGKRADFSEYFWVSLIIGINYLKSTAFAALSLRSQKYFQKELNHFSLVLDIVGLVLIIYGYRKEFSTLLIYGIIQCLILLFDLGSNIRAIKQKRLSE